VENVSVETDTIFSWTDGHVRVSAIANSINTNLQGTTA